MAYIPVYAEEAADDTSGAVRISPARLQTLGVRTERAELRPPAGRSIQAVGTMQFDERRLATVTTHVPGWIEHVDVAAEEEYLIATRMGGAVASASLKRLRALNIPDGEFARLRHSGRSARRIPVVAQAGGVVIDKPVQEGMRVEAGEALYRTVELSSLWLIAQVQEQDLGAIVPGQTARASFVAFPGRTFEGGFRLTASLAIRTHSSRPGRRRRTRVDDIHLSSAHHTAACRRRGVSIIVKNFFVFLQKNIFLLPTVM